MSKKKPSPSEVLEYQHLAGEPAYVRLDGDAESQDAAMKSFSDSVEDFRGIQKAEGRWHSDLSNLDTNISGRPGLSQSDYYSFRPDERPARKFKHIVTQVENVYQNEGLIRNIIDLMGDFACQGIRIVHPNRRIEKFYQNWFIRVKGKERSERFLNNFYRTGNVIVQRQTAKISSKHEKRMMKTVAVKTVANPDMEIVIPKVEKRVIPWKYTFLDPRAIEVVGGPLSSFVGEPLYAIVLPDSLRRIINSPTSSLDRQLVAKLPDDIIAAAKTNSPVLLNKDKLSVFFYKKDDWQVWALPMIYAILSDISVLQKLKLADMAALDGAIQNIRVWKLGSLEHNIAPTRKAAAKLAEILESNTGGGTMDLVWGPDIVLEQTNSDVYKFLGQEKYIPHLNSIYAGLGIPPTLTGTVGAAGTTNNFISLKTLTQRLEYGRDTLESFWIKEIAMVQEAMGFRFPARVEFTFDNLGDEASEKALWIQLADRNLISDELLQYKFKNNPELERIRLNREARERSQGKMIPKSGPYYDPQFGVALKKLALQTGVMTPGQVGLREDADTRDLKTFKVVDGEKPALEMRALQTKPQESKKPSGPKGRPKNSKDTKKRERKFKPQVRAAIEIWAGETQNAIDEVVNPYILGITNKKTMRSLNSKEIEIAKKLKFKALFNLNPFDSVTENTVRFALTGSDISNEVIGIYKDWIYQVGVDVGRTLSSDEIKQVQVHLYASIKEENNDDD